MIERVISPLKRLRGVNGSVRFLFVAQEEDCTQLSLDNVLHFITDGAAEVIRLKSPTVSAVCSCLMAVDRLDSAADLIIVTRDTVIDAAIRKHVQEFITPDRNST